LFSDLLLEELCIMSSIKKRLRDRIAALGVDHPSVQDNFLFFLEEAFPKSGWLDFLLLKSQGKEVEMLAFLEKLPEPDLCRPSVQKREISPLVLEGETYFRTADVVHLCASPSARAYAYSASEKLLYGKKVVSVLDAYDAVEVLRHFGEYGGMDLLQSLDPNHVGIPDPPKPAEPVLTPQAQEFLARMSKSAGGAS